jgi:CheY-like chemotaxis protein
MNSQPSNGEFSPLYSPQNRPMVILSVDDEPGILLTRRLLLENAGYQVLSAADGEQALEIFSSQSVDLVLLDYVLPGRDGGSIAQDMKRCKQSVPIILVSASPMPQGALACMDCSIDKGLGPAVLLEKIAEFLTSLSIDSQPLIVDTSVPEEKARERSPKGKW